MLGSRRGLWRIFVLVAAVLCIAPPSAGATGARGRQYGPPAGA